MDVPIAEPAWGSAHGFVAIPAATEEADRSALLARVEIRERIHRYAWAFDERQRDALTDCFTEDAVWAGNTAGAEPVDPIRGRKAIVEWLSGFWVRQQDQRRHLMMSVLVSLDGPDAASALASLALTAAQEKRVAVVLTSFYQFELVRLEGAWRIASLFEGFDAGF